MTDVERAHTHIHTQKERRVLDLLPVVTPTH